MKICLKIIVALLIGHVVKAQKISDKVLNGKVVSEAVNLEGIYVINLNTDQTATTANEGFYHQGKCRRYFDVCSAVH